MSEFQMLPARYPIFAVYETEDGRTLRRIVLGWTADWFFTFPPASMCEKGQFIGMDIPNIGFLPMKTLNLKAKAP